VASVPPARYVLPAQGVSTTSWVVLNHEHGMQVCAMSRVWNYHQRGTGDWTLL